MNSRMGYKVLGSVMLLVTMIVPGLAQQANLNLEGVIRDEFSSAPVGCKMYIYTPSGKKISISSNSKDGTYLQTLSEAGTHKITLSGHNIYRTETTVDIPSSTKFKIIKQDFMVKTLQEGKVLQSGRGFERNSAVLNAEGNRIVKEIIDVARANQEMNIHIKVGADEDQLAPIRAKVNADFAKQTADYEKALAAHTKALKKLKKNATPPPAPIAPVRAADPTDPNPALIQQRIGALKKALDEVKNGDLRLTYSSDNLPAQASAPTTVQVAATAPSKAKGKKAPTTAAATAAPVVQQATSHPTLIVTIGKVKKLFD